MTPYLRAMAVYEREPCARSFHEDFWLHLMHGHVVSTPEVFGLLRPVRSDWTADRLLDPSQVDKAGDTWWLWLAAGDVGRLFHWFPAKKWVAYERRNSPRFVEYERIRRLCRPRVGAGFVSPERAAGAAS